MKLCNPRKTPETPARGYWSVIHAPCAQCLSGNPGKDQVHAVSNTLTYIQTADYDPLRNELIFSELTTQGRASDHTLCLLPTREDLTHKITRTDRTGNQ